MTKTKKKIKNDVPKAFFDGKKSFIIKYPAGWKIKKYFSNGAGGEIVLVKK